jgi:hypothetical protein
MAPEEISRVFGVAITRDFESVGNGPGPTSVIPIVEVLSETLGVGFPNSKQYFDSVGRAIGEGGGAYLDMLRRSRGAPGCEAAGEQVDAAENEKFMLEAAEKARGIFLFSEDNLSAAPLYGFDGDPATVPAAIDKINALPAKDQAQLRQSFLKQVSLLRAKYDNVSQFQAPGESPTKFIQKVVVDTAAKAVQFNDDNYLAFVLECCFGLPAATRYRGALASYLQPFALPTGAENGAASLESVMEKSAKLAQERLAKIFQADEPILFVRGTILQEAGFIHRDKRRPLVADGQPIVSLDYEGGSALDRILQSPGGPLIGRSLDKRAWAEIAEQLDIRTAEELRAYLAGELKSGSANYKHFKRQVDRPSRLGLLILQQLRKGAVEERLIVRVPGGPPTSFWKHENWLGAFLSRTSAGSVAPIKHSCAPPSRAENLLSRQGICAASPFKTQVLETKPNTIRKICLSSSFRRHSCRTCKKSPAVRATANPAVFALLRRLKRTPLTERQREDPSLNWSPPDCCRRRWSTWGTNTNGAASAEGNLHHHSRSMSGAIVSPRAGRPYVPSRPAATKAPRSPSLKAAPIAGVLQPAD